MGILGERLGRYEGKATVMETVRGPSEVDFSSLRSAVPIPWAPGPGCLLTSGTYARDDEYGSRAINPMELYHNQVTRVQGPFSLRMFHRSWGLMLIQANIAAPCTLLDFPTLDRFIQEIRDHHYDVVGISSITTNVLKVRRMCRLVRRHQPAADRRRRPRRQPARPGGAGRRGLDRARRGRALVPPLPRRRPGPAHSSSGIPRGSATWGPSVSPKPRPSLHPIPRSVARWAATSAMPLRAMFGGKGTWSIYETGDELFDIMCQIERPSRTSPSSSWTRTSSSTAKRVLDSCGIDGAARQAVDPIRLLFRRRAQARSPSSNWSPWASPGCGWGWRERKAVTRS